MVPCASCHELVLGGTCVCPMCGEKACASRSVGGAALLLGLTLAAGCGGKDNEDTASTPTGTVQADYSAASTGSSSARSTPTHELVGALVDRERAD